MWTHHKTFWRLLSPNRVASTHDGDREKRPGSYSIDSHRSWSPPRLPSAPVPRFESLRGWPGAPSAWRQNLGLVGINYSKLSEVKAIIVKIKWYITYLTFRVFLSFGISNYDCFTTSDKSFPTYANPKFLLENRKCYLRAVQVLLNKNLHMNFRIH